MSERIDHAAEARRLAVIADRAMQAGVEPVTSLAQVHATLALVEQQRIGNLIALMDSNRASTNDVRAALNALSEGEPVVDRRLRPDIARALGIEVSE